MPTPVTSQPAAVLLRFVARHRALLVPVGFILMLAVVVVPLPPPLLDLLIALNISLAVITLMTTIYLEEPLQFSVFPSLLLGTTLLRLVLNIASTRLILTADAATPQEAIGVAGKIISAFGDFVAGDSLIVGAIIFLIIIVVQFVVITKGATRISEVAARFTLDAMPGKQMAIDADLNAGIIDEKEAKARRQHIGDEADFFGAMDGASKFVRGDAIAGIIITIVNIVGGFAVGALEKGWPIADSAAVFTKLTIGDGLVSQIPSFVISIAAALIVTRAGAKSSLGEEMADQVTSRPVALGIAACFMGALAFTPLPTLPMLLASVVLATTAYFLSAQSRAARSAQSAKAAAAPARPEPPAVEKLLKVDTMELEVGYALVTLVDAAQGGDLLERIAAVRRQLAIDLGLVMPPVRIRDNMTLDPHAYRVRIRASEVAEGRVYPGKLLAMDSGIATGRIPGEKTVEPAFGLEAWWIEPAQKPRADSLNYTVVDPSSVIATHLSEISRRHADELLSREEVNNLIEQLKEKSPRLVAEVVPAVVKPADLQKILQNLLRERVPIRDLETILETLGEWAPRTKDYDVLTEYVRNSLRRAICERASVPPERASASRARRIICVTLDPAFEDLVSGYIDRGPAGTTLSMPASVANRLSRRVVDAMRPVLSAGHQPVVIASPQVRAVVRQILEPHLPNVTVLGYNEVISGVEVESMGLVTAPEESRQTVGAA